MIVSYEHNFIFVKSRKTAGTSMEIALSSHAGEQDIVTPLASQDELTRLSMYPKARPRNFLSDPVLEERYIAAVIRGDEHDMMIQRKVELSDEVILHNHASAKRAIKMLGQSTWDSAYKFTIERHPYEKCVSWAWSKKGERGLAETLDYTIEKGKYRNYDLYTLNGEIAVDFIIRYEKMEEDLKQVERRLGLDIFSRLPRAKGNFREDRRPAAEVLNAAQKRAIRDYCTEEFALMGYDE